MDAKWISVDDRKHRPPIDKIVRVIWRPSEPTDRKTAIWDGDHWWTARRAGIHDENPTYWLYEPPAPAPPTE